MTLKNTILPIALLMVFSCRNENRQLRGFEEKSTNEKSYLVIEEGNCDEYYLDDERWPYSVGEKGEVAPGEHCLSCGENGEPVFAGTCFTVKEKTVFHFDYWGP